MCGHLIGDKRIEGEEMNIRANGSGESGVIMGKRENLNLSDGHIHKAGLLYRRGRRRRSRALLLNVKGQSYDILGPRNAKP